MSRATPVGFGQCNGTFGELLQGVLPRQQRHFLVTCPISLQAWAWFTPLATTAGLQVVPAHKHKARRLAELLLQRWGLPVGGELRLHSELPEGKGLASSSADLVATARAIGSACGRSLAPAALARLMAAVEPSDGVMYDDAVAFYHREGMLRRRLGALPPLTIIGVDEGGTVDTVAFNGRHHAFTRAEQAEYGALLRGLESAVAGADLQAIGQIATRSALLHQHRQPKRCLPLLLDLCQCCGAPGVVVAHSGTYAGVLLDPAGPAYPGQLAAIREQLARLPLRVTTFYTDGAGAVPVAAPPT